MWWIFAWSEYLVLMTPLTTEITWNRRLLIKLTGNRNFLIPKTAIWKDSICDSNRSERHFQADLGLTYNLSTLTLTVKAILGITSCRLTLRHFATLAPTWPMRHFAKKNVTSLRNTKNRFHITVLICFLCCSSESW